MSSSVGSVCSCSDLLVGAFAALCLCVKASVSRPKRLRLAAPNPIRLAWTGPPRTCYHPAKYAGHGSPKPQKRPRLWVTSFQSQDCPPPGRKYGRSMVAPLILHAIPFTSVNSEDRHLHDTCTDFELGKPEGRNGNILSTKYPNYAK